VLKTVWNPVRLRKGEQYAYKRFEDTMCKVGHHQITHPLHALHNTMQQT